MSIISNDITNCLVQLIKQDAPCRASGGGWSFGGFFEQIKQQTSELVDSALSSELVEATKRDLAVFVSTITEESAKGLAETSATIATKLNQTDADSQSGMRPHCLMGQLVPRGIYILHTAAGVRGEVASLLSSFSQKVGVSSQSPASASSGLQPKYACHMAASPCGYIAKIHC